MACHRLKHYGRQLQPCDRTTSRYPRQISAAPCSSSPYSFPNTFGSTCHPLGHRAAFSAESYTRHQMLMAWTFGTIFKRPREHVQHPSLRDLLKLAHATEIPPSLSQGWAKERSELL